MRRFIIRRLAVAAIGLFVAAVALLAASFHPDWPSHPLQLAHDRWGNGIAYVQVAGGRASLFSEIDFDSADSPKPYVANPRTIVAPKVTKHYQFALPGLNFQFCRFAEGPPTWSLGLSLAIPAGLSLIVALFLIRRLRGRRPRDTVAHDGAASS